jgi:hypothetical protein
MVRKTLTLLRSPKGIKSRNVVFLPVQSGAMDPQPVVLIHFADGIIVDELEVG